MIGSLLRERNDLRVENLRLQVELERYKKCYYGPRADRLADSGDMAQMLLQFAEGLERRPVNPDDLPPHTEPEEDLRRVKRRRGRRLLANFENLPVTTRVYELNTEQRACPCCGEQRKEIGAEQSWQVEYLPGHFERIHHVRKKYACPGCEMGGETHVWKRQASRNLPSIKAWLGQGCWFTSSPASFPTTSRCTVWKIFSRGRVSRSRARRSQSGAAMWLISWNRCMN
jgi:zinc-finger binding domain of transposase IS66